MGTERVDMCRQDSCTLEMDGSSDLWKSGGQLTDWHSASPAAMQKRAPYAEGLSWNPAVAEETSLGHIR